MDLLRTPDPAGLVVRDHPTQARNGYMYVEQDGREYRLHFRQFHS